MVFLSACPAILSRPKLSRTIFSTRPSLSSFGAVIRTRNVVGGGDFVRDVAWKQGCERRVARQPEQKQQPRRQQQQQQRLVVVRTSRPVEPSPRGDVAGLGHDPRSPAAADGPHRRRAGLDNARQWHKVRGRWMDGCARSIGSAERGCFDEFSLFVFCVCCRSQEHHLPCD